MFNFKKTSDQMKIFIDLQFVANNAIVNLKQ